MTDYAHIRRSKTSIRAVCGKSERQTDVFGHAIVRFSEELAEFESAWRNSAVPHAPDQLFVTSLDRFVTSASYGGGIVLKQGDGIFGPGTGRTVFAFVRLRED